MDYVGSVIGIIKGDTRSFDYGSYVIIGFADSGRNYCRG